MPYTIGISAEFMASYDEELSYEYEFPVIEHLFIMGFGIVGDVGNVNSSGINLSAEEADKMALADLFGKKKKMIKKRSKNLKLNKQNQTKSPKNLKWQQKNQRNRMLKKMTKESEAELSEKKTIHSNNFIIYLWSKMKKWLLSLNSYVLKINL